MHILFSSTSSSSQPPGPQPQKLRTGAILEPARSFPPCPLCPLCPFSTSTQAIINQAAFENPMPAKNMVLVLLNKMALRKGVTGWGLQNVAGSNSGCKLQFRGPIQEIGS